MPVYTYTAKDSSGNARAGTVDASSESSAYNLLKQQGLFVVSISEKRTSVFDFLKNVRGVPQNEIVVVTRQMSTMISAGLPVARTLEVMSEQTSNPTMRKVLLDVLRDVEGGAALSTAFGRYPKIFSPTYQALTRAGEASGKLDEILNRLADTLEAQRELRAKFKAAMIYPAIVFTAMIGVFIIMLTFVIPRLATMYESLNVELPAITQFMINLSDFFVNRWYIIILGVIGLVLLYRVFVSSEYGKDMVSKLLFNIPVFGKINKQKEFAEFTKTLSLLIASAIPIVEALNISSDVASNLGIKRAALNAAQSVEKGNSLSSYFRGDPIFPPLIGQMASVGEETGELDNVLDRIADFYAKETDHAVKGLSSALEPIILIALGGMVGVLIVSIITPIYKITSAL